MPEELLAVMGLPSVEELLNILKLAWEKSSLTLGRIWHVEHQSLFQIYQPYHRTQRPSLESSLRCGSMCLAGKYGSGMDVPSVGFVLMAEGLAWIENLILTLTCHRPNTARRLFAYSRGPPGSLALSLDFTWVALWVCSDLGWKLDVQEHDRPSSGLALIAEKHLHVAAIKRALPASGETRRAHASSETPCPCQQ